MCHRLHFELYGSIGLNPSAFHDDHCMHDNVLSCPQEVSIGYGGIGTIE